MEGLKAIPYLALIITIAGVVLGATVIVLDKYGDSVSKCWNASYTFDTTTGTKCTNVSNSSMSYDGPSGSNLTREMYTISKGITSEGDIAEQLPTVAIIGVMVVILSIIAGVFVYLRYFA